MNFDSQISTLLILIRGDASQTELSHQFGSSYNIAHKWESGSKRLLWSEFVKICQIRNIDLQTALLELCGLPLETGLEQSKVVQFFAQIETGRERLDQAFSAQKLRRLELGETQLTLNDFLILVDALLARTQRFFLLIHASVQPAAAGEVEYLDLAASNPSITLVHHFLGLQEYRRLPEHSDEYIAVRLELPQEFVHDACAILLRTGAVEHVGKHYVTVNRRMDSRAGNKKENSRKISQFWRSRVNEHLATVTGSSDRLKSAFLAYESDSEKDAELFALANRFYLEFMNIVHRPASGSERTINLMNIDLFRAYGSNEKN